MPLKILPRTSRNGAVTKLSTTAKSRPRAKTAESQKNPAPKPKRVPSKKNRVAPLQNPGEPPLPKGYVIEEEKRLKRFRPKPPASFDLKLHRAQAQRMIVLARRRTDRGYKLFEEIDIVGSTGNIYTVTIGREASCTCPDSRKGNECKHKVYALHTVLKAPEDLQYQLAFLTSELETIFVNAPAIPTDRANDASGARKPCDGECPICYFDLDYKNNALVWCKAQCGHNIHKQCFDQWVASQRGRDVRCVYCRTPWEQDLGDVSAIKRAGKKTEEGYLNVGVQFGISRDRDYSSYHRPWNRRQYGWGW